MNAMMNLINGECLEVMAKMPDNSFDLILTDPPYFRVKNEPWDRQWNKPDAFLKWLGQCMDQWARLLKPNGSLYCFASHQMSARIEAEIGRRMNVLNSITWAKTRGRWNKSRKESLRCFFPSSERITFAEHYGADNIAKGEAGYAAKCDELRGFLFEPLRAYLDGERKRAGVDKIAVNVACGFSASPGGMASRHYFSRSQWDLPTADHYRTMQDLFNANGGNEYLRRDYEYLRRDYEDLRREYEDLRRPFAVSKDVPHTDVWTFDPVKSYKGKHPCEKPQELLLHMIKASTRPGSTVLDCFMGTGSTGIACKKIGLHFTGIELCETYFNTAKERIEQA